MNKKGYHKSFKSKRKRFPLKAFFSIFLSLLLFSGLGYLFLFSSYFQIKEITILDNHEIRGEDIKTAILEEINTSKNIFLADTAASTELIKKRFPKIANVSVKKKLPSKIAIQIEERKPIVALEGNGAAYYIDKEGVTFERVNKDKIGVPILLILGLSEEIKEGKSILAKEDAEKLAAIINGFENILKIPLENVTWISEYRVDAKTFEGWKVYISLEEEIAWQLDKLDTLLKEKIPSGSRRKIEYIDLRFDKIYVFPQVSGLKDPAEK